MSIDRLQDKIRKLKNPTVVDFSILPEHIPPYLIETAGSFLPAYKHFCRELLVGLSGIIPAVRFDFNGFSLYGAEGLSMLEDVLQLAKQQGYYVLLDGVQALSAQSAEQGAHIFLSKECKWYFDGIILSAYIGSDALSPYISRLKEYGKDLFAVVRTSNKTAPELQDLLTGTRLVHMANADIINRFSQPLVCRCGYSQASIMAAASSVDSLRSLRVKYRNLFILLDGCDYPNANAKNCSYAFDNLGHGAAACAGSSITAAWCRAQSTGEDYVEQAISAAERLKKNLLRYVTIL